MSKERRGQGSQTTASSRRTHLWAVGSIVVLALVIYGTSALTSPRDSSDDASRARLSQPSNSAGASDRSESLYQQALEAQRSGDTTRALGLAEQAVQVNPNNVEAKQLVEVIAAAPSNATTRTASASASSPAQPRVADIATLLPKAVSGYSFGTPQVIKTDAVVSADPMPQATDASRISTVLFSVHDRGSAAAAAKWVETVNKRVYSHDRVGVAIDGRPGSFGTDGTRLSSAAFASGPYVFELICTVSQGKPVATKDIALRLAETFPVQR